MQSPNYCWGFETMNGGIAAFNPRYVSSEAVAGGKATEQPAAATSTTTMSHKYTPFVTIYSYTIKTKWIL
jgi:hypothetical protein